MPDEGHGDVADLCRYLDASPSPFHAVQAAVERLEASGFEPLAEDRRWAPGDVSGRRYVRSAGSLVAWWQGPRHGPGSPLRLVGAHTDSPNLRIKPRPDTGRAGYRQLGVEVYGGVLLNSWLDRDLGVSGRVAVRGDDGGVDERLVVVDEPVLRLPQLAIHLDREVNERGLVLDRQAHLAPIWGLGGVDRDGFARFLAERLDVDPRRVVAWDVMTHDLSGARLVGLDRDLLASARIDNLVSCHSAVQALIGAVGEDSTAVPVICLFDHEEVGSTSARGADSTSLVTLLERRVGAAGGDREDLHASLAASWCISADGAHATHPNHVERHEPDHLVALNGGPVVKINASQRYATDALTHAVAVEACERAGVPFQLFVTRSNLACGSTIGPVTAARLGIRTVDLGVAQLAMHSARETAGALDPPRLTAALGAFLSPPPGPRSG